MTMKNNGVYYCPEMVVVRVEKAKSTRRRSINIDGNSFNSMDSAIEYLVDDGMTSTEAFNFLIREAY